jgi:hypothetical protein
MYKILIAVLTCMLLVSASSTAKADEPAATSAQVVVVQPQERHRWVGMQFDVGAPDGVALGVVVRPYVNWARLNLSGTYNAIAPGIRGGLTLDPIKFPVAPTLTFEGGHAWQGDIPGQGSKLPQVGYDYMNLHLGLEFGNRDHWRFFLQGGPSWLHITTNNFQSVVGSSDPNLLIGNPTANVSVIPTAKLGFALYF